jgi:pimeloyl-ACP methyl ester carboxylesterase
VVADRAADWRSAGGRAAAASQASVNMIGVAMGIQSVAAHRVGWAVMVSAAVALTAGAATGRAQPAAQAGGGSEAVVPFRIQVPDAVLTDLKGRLQRARFADEFPGVGWDYGTNLDYIRSLVTYWRDSYDWRAQERRLNRFSQFKTQIGGLDIHFIHQKSSDPNAVPLLLLNGWPSSPVEYDKVIEPLTGQKGGGGAAAFHVVVPSMPGYGFSDKPRERGYNPERMAQVWASLMARLGYRRYLVHGSDWGIAVATYLALADSSHISGLHLAGCPGAPLGGPPPPRAPGTPAPPVSSNLGYQEIQTTKPQTLGHGLSDSPLGLASWIIDKWHSWSDHDGDLEQVYTKDDLLTNIMFYWVTNSGTSSARLYYESRHVDGQLQPTFFSTFMPAISRGKVTVPTGCGAFPSQFDNRGLPINRDPAIARKAAATRYNVVHASIAAKGGHFPALEQPQAWLDDLRTFVRGLAAK